MNDQDDAAAHFTALLDGYLRAARGAGDDVLAGLTARFVERLDSGIAEYSEAGRTAHELREALSPVRLELSKSAFLRRLQTWPRGYPGDFETIRHLLNGEVEAPSGTPAYWFEALALRSPIARQHRNKITAQAAMIREVALGRQSARILVLACGGAQDVALAQASLLARDVRLVLNDADPEALALAAHTLSSLAAKLHIVPGNALRRIGRLRRLGPFDLVVAGGLFDYLPARHAAFIAAQVTSMLVEGGRFFFSNIAAPNPFKAWMELCVDWRLIERSREEMNALVAGTGGTADLSRDETGLAWLCTVTR